MSPIRARKARYTLGQAALVVLLLTVTAAAQAGQVTALAGDFDPPRPRYPRSPPDLPGTDIALVGGPWWQSVPVAFSLGDGTFGVTNEPIGAFASWATASGVTRLAGDFNGDRKTDIALLGGAGWSSVPVAFSRGDGRFLVTNAQAVSFANSASRPGTDELVGDFDGNGKTDLALLVEYPTLAQLEIGFSNGNGTFDHRAVGGFSPDPHAQVGDFNGDGKSDVMEPYCPYPSIWVQYMMPPQNPGQHYFGELAEWACQPEVRLLVGRFNHDSLSDLLVLGAPEPEFAVVALFQPYPANFTETLSFVGEFASWALDPEIHLVVGDFDGDALSDVALLGDELWPMMPVAFSNGDGTFRVTAEDAGDFPAWAAGPSVTRHLGDFNNDGKADIALTGGWGWNTLPVAFSNGDGTFRVTNEYIGDFAEWAGR